MSEINFTKEIKEIEERRSGKMNDLAVRVKLKNGKVVIGKFNGCSESELSLVGYENHFFRSYDVESIREMDIGILVFLIGILDRNSRSINDLVSESISLFKSLK